LCTNINSITSFKQEDSSLSNGRFRTLGNLSIIIVDPFAVLLDIANVMTALIISSQVDNNAFQSIIGLVYLLNSFLEGVLA